MLRTCRRSAPETATGKFPKGVPNISSRLDAGSVLTKSTVLPPSTSAKAAAQAIEVLPTPPLPVKNKKRVGLTRNPGGPTVLLSFMPSLDPLSGVQNCVASVVKPYHH